MSARTTYKAEQEAPGQSNSGRRVVESEKRVSRLDGTSPTFRVPFTGRTSRSSTTSQQVLSGQRLIGNRAVCRLIHAASAVVEPEEEPIGVGEVLRYIVTTSVPDSEAQKSTLETRDALQPNISRYQAETSTSTGPQLNWGTANTSGSIAARHTHAKVGSNSETVFWGSSATLGFPQPASLGAIQQMSGSDERIDGSMASGPPVGTTVLGIQGHSGGIWEIGWTYFPTGYRAPNFDFNSKDKGRGGKTEWYASPTQTATAFEGTGDSYYATAGLHKTAHKEGGKDVYWNFSAAMSARDDLAEQEHCNDHAHAYNISLKEAEDVLIAHVIGKDFGPNATKAEAEQMALKAITDNLTHAALGNDKTTWAAKYDTLFRKTGERDTKLWHSFALGGRRTNKAGDVIYDAMTGTTKVGTVTSATIIKY